MKKPYYFKHPDDTPLAVAAIWDTWREKDGDEIQSCCLITTKANDLMSPVHDRMPVILTDEQQNIWLNHSHTPKEALTGLLAPLSF